MSDDGWKQTGKWSEDEFWDHETGAPTLTAFGNAVQVWTLLQERDNITVAEAAAAFKVPAARIREAVEDHYWMFLAGPDDDPTKETIEHDGE